MKQKTNEKGITLIALVITIIVMLILVAVTVTIAMDGGLFTKSKDAGDKTTIEAEKETLTNVALGEYDGVKGGIDLDNVEESLKTGNTKDKWTNIKKDSAKNIITLQGKQSGKWYVIYGSGTVEKIKNTTENDGVVTATITLDSQTTTITLSGEEVSARDLSGIFLGIIGEKDDNIWYGEGESFTGYGKPISISGKIPDEVDINNVDFSEYDLGIKFEDEFMYIYADEVLTVEANKNAEYAKQNETPTFTKKDLSGIKTTMFGVPVTSISRFENCTTLESITIPSSIKSIEREAFYGCTGLTNVTILNGVKSICYCAFYGCTNLTSVTIPSSVTMIVDDAFANCSSLTSITVGSEAVKTLVEDSGYTGTVTVNTSINN